MIINLINYNNKCLSPYSKINLNSYRNWANDTETVRHMKVEKVVI